MAIHLIDSHAHLTYPPLSSQLELIVARARASGVSRITTVGTDPDDSRQAVELAEKYPEIYAAVGIHPHKADDYQSVDSLKLPLSHPKVIALGETGLDYHYHFADRDHQQRLFEAHLELAGQSRLPVIVHCRESFDATLSTIRSAGKDICGVFHCFSGNERQAREVMALGWYLSFSGTVTFKRADELREAAKIVDLDRLLIETDCPYLSPEPVRKNKTNEPANVLHVAKCLAKILQLPLDRFSQIIVTNTERLFGELFLPDSA